MKPKIRRDEQFGEKCAIFGAFNTHEAAKLTYFGLYALQHRGQESSGISVSNGEELKSHKGMGLVPQVYTEEILENLPGNIAIGHNRYSTSGGSFFEYTQPFTGKENLVALAHNGNIPDTKELVAFLESKGIETKDRSDSGLMHLAISYYMKEGKSLEDAITASFPLFKGAFCLLVMTKDKIAAIRDEYGIRPLSIGKLNGGHVFASETCALATVNAQFLRDVTPGEMVVASKDGLQSYQLAKSNQKLDIFEFVYFSRPDSILLGKRVYEVRKNLGRELANECNIEADVVIPVPDSSIPAAIGYAHTSGIPFEFGLMKNRYIGRTFIMPDQRLRDKSVQMKLNPIKEVIEGKSLVVIDDSIVRGTTAKKLITMLREYGAKKVHLLISCPPVRYPDFYGIDTPIQKDLISANMNTQEIKKFIGADSLHFLSYEGMIKATGLPENVFCTSCFTGIYPIDIGDKKDMIKKISE
jgi:amidophosphoribosyltransferase